MSITLWWVSVLVAAPLMIGMAVNLIRSIWSTSNKRTHVILMAVSYGCLLTASLLSSGPVSVSEPVIHTMVLVSIFIGVKGLLMLGSSTVVFHDKHEHAPPAHSHIR